MSQSNQYILGKETKKRLSGLENSLDTATITYLSKIGVSEGWTCLEVGAGGGSITEWLCQCVGPTGHVVATDIGTHLLEVLDYENLEVRQHNIVTDDLEVEKFDLVHIRYVLGHLPERELVLEKLTKALKPNGWILVEDGDNMTHQAEQKVSPPHAVELYTKVFGALKQAMEASGLAFNLGGNLYGHLVNLGYKNINTMGAFELVRGGTKASEFYKMSTGKLKDLVVGMKLSTSEEYDSFVALFDNPDFALWSYATMSAWGQKPEN